jgi:hypothetical protein
VRIAYEQITFVLIIILLQIIFNLQEYSSRSTVLHAFSVVVYTYVSYYEVTLLLIKMNTLYMHFYMNYNNPIRIFIPDGFVLSLADRHCIRL